MSDLAIQIANMGKMYKLYTRPADRVLDAFGLAKWMFWRKHSYQEFWALRGIDLTIAKGERLGIIGRNGAGKSTLLKIIAGNVTPAEGDVSVQGSIQALMELGTGFHPEFTGRQNIRAYLSYHGFTPGRIAEREEEIIDFAELENFIEQPIKTYSAGMYARLAFSTATAIEPEILIIDEVLGAGDAYFTGKCVDRMTQLTNRSGATVLFVSHSLASIQQLCSRVVWLDRGQVRADGDPQEVTKAYYASIIAQENVRLRARNAQIGRKQMRDMDSKGQSGATKRELLFRFVSARGKELSQRHPVGKLSLLLNDQVLATATPGAAMDNDADHEAYLLTDTKTMLWDKPEVLDDRRVRCIAATGGAYRHAPFVMECLADHEQQELKLAVEHAASDGDVINVELFNGETYVPVGRLTAGGGWREEQWSLPEEHSQDTDDAETLERVYEQASLPDLGEDTATDAPKPQQPGQVPLHQSGLDRFYSDYAEFTAVELRNEAGESQVLFEPGQSIRMSVHVSVTHPLPPCWFSCALYSMDNVVLASLYWPISSGLTPGDYSWDIDIRGIILRQGEYLLSPAILTNYNDVTNEDVVFYCQWNRAPSFRIEEGYVGQRPLGLLCLPTSPPDGSPLDIRTDNVLQRRPDAAAPRD